MFGRSNGNDVCFPPPKLSFLFVFGKLGVSGLFFALLCSLPPEIGANARCQNGADNQHARHGDVRPEVTVVVEEYRVDGGECNAEKLGGGIQQPGGRAFRFRVCQFRS